MAKEVLAMTEKQKQQIIRLQREGCGYSEIAGQIGVSRDSVKSFCRRNGLTVTTKAVCRQCGAELTYTPHRRKKIFCSDTCRMAWWNAHPELVQRKAVYHLTCAHCGIEFECYGNAKRKYCSRECYNRARAKAVES